MVELGKTLFTEFSHAPHSDGVSTAVVVGMIGIGTKLLANCITHGVADIIQDK